MLAVSTPIQFFQGEHVFGHYQVQIARLTGSGWVGAVPPLNATVTNARLILKPQTRKPYPEASIPARYIVKVHIEDFGPRKGVLIGLKIGYDLNLLVGWGQTGLFHADLKRMVTPSVRMRFIPSLPESDVVRLIKAIGKL